MGYNFSELGRKVHEQPQQAREEIEAAFQAAGGSRKGAAAELDVLPRKLLRWIVRLEKAGFPIRVERQAPGWPAEARARAAAVRQERPARKAKKRGKPRVS